MIDISFAPSFQKHVRAGRTTVEAETVASALNQVFEDNPSLRGYVLDDRGVVRHHVTIFVNNTTIRDRTELSDSLKDGDQVFVFQALSGG